MLELKGLRKRYDGVVALDGCTLTARRGRILGFLGRNGAGKTTALRSIFGLVALDEGSVLWEGRPVHREQYRRFGYMPETRGLYPRMPVRRQLEYFGRLRGLSAREAAAEAAGWLERLGLAERAESRLEALSHGNQQRLQLAVALAGRPALLVLDEPFSGLDPIAVDALTEIVREATAGGAAVVFSTHQLDLAAELSDDIAIITGGRVVLEGDLHELRRASPVRYVEVSFEEALDGPAAERLAAGVAGGVLVSRAGRALRLRIAVDASPVAVLEAASGCGRIEYFKLEPPTLEEVFREVAQD